MMCTWWRRADSRRRCIHVPFSAHTAKIPGDSIHRESPREEVHTVALNVGSLWTVPAIGMPLIPQRGDYIRWGAGVAGKKRPGEARGFRGHIGHTPELPLEWLGRDSTLCRASLFRKGEAANQGGLGPCAAMTRSARWRR